MNLPSLDRDLVLLGGGHTHALALRMLAMSPPPATRITLVSENSFAPYSGMLPGLVAGHYDFHDTHIDLRRYCAALGVRFVEASASGIDAARRRVELVGRPALEYDLLSINIGAQPDLDAVPGAREHAVPVKPVSNFYQRWQVLEQRLGQDLPSAGGVVVVGGGAGSLELALAMRHRMSPQNVPVRLLCGQSLLEGYNPRALAAVRRACDEHGVEIHEHSRVTGVEASQLQVESGQTYPFDELVWCTGVVAARWLKGSGLPSDERGFLLIEDSLRLQDKSDIFAAGDVAVQQNNPRPRAGVFAVRQAPVLAHNLSAALAGRPLKDHRPQRRFLSLLSLGDRRAVADRGPFSASGSWVWRWKDSIDREFMSRFSELPSAMPEPTETEESAMRCGGCGAKLPAATLRSVLADLAGQYPAAIAASQLSEDAAVLDWSPQQQLVQSVDTLRSLVDDPWMMGRITVLHALSDIYAMGAEPHSALVHLSLPYAGPQLQRRELGQLMSGVLKELERAGCQLVGGHSMEGPELAIGITANGALNPGAALPKVAAAAGHKLVLTKPLGTGVVFAGAMENKSRGDYLAAACTSMLQSNREAAALGRQHGASACTDITGFGLLGHLLEMVRGSGLQVRIKAASVLALPGADALLSEGVRSTLQPGNVEALGGELESLDQVAQDQALLFDPQTSGGLVIAVADSASTDLLRDLEAAGYQAAVIGELQTRVGDNCSIRVD